MMSLGLNGRGKKFVWIDLIACNVVQNFKLLFYRFRNAMINTIAANHPVYQSRPSCSMGSAINLISIKARPTRIMYDLNSRPVFIFVLLKIYSFFHSKYYDVKLVIG